MPLLRSRFVGLHSCLVYVIDNASHLKMSVLCCYDQHCLVQPELLVLLCQGGSYVAGLRVSCRPAPHLLGEHILEWMLCRTT
jgi:hypothetical protein